MFPKSTRHQASALILAAVTLTACTPAAGSTKTTPANTHTTHTTGTAAKALATLEVKAPAPITGYSRARFGQAWADINHSGCDTRDQILKAQLTHVQLKPGTHGCVVLAGDLADPYTATTVHYRRNHSVVDIDHVTALGAAWQTGAASWTPAQRLHYANDPLNLLAVDSRNNRQKGDATAATWLPPKGKCAYVARQVAVQVKYHLWISKPEKAAMVKTLDTCPNQSLPVAGAA